MIITTVHQQISDKPFSSMCDVLELMGNTFVAGIAVSFLTRLRLHRFAWCTKVTDSGLYRGISLCHRPPRVNVEEDHKH